MPGVYKTLGFLFGILPIRFPAKSSRTGAKEMLVLSRTVGERILIGDSIAIEVVRIVGKHVRIGVEAPPDLLVLRDELTRHDAGSDDDSEAA